MTGALGFAALAVAIGVAIGLLSGPPALTADPISALLPLGFLGLTVFGMIRFSALPRINKVGRQQQLVIAVVIVAVTLLTIVASEVSLTLSMPTSASWVAGFCVGLALVGAWIERDASLPGAKIAVLLLYVACGVAAISTLLTNLPASSFWIISAVIPAWQARRLVGRGELEASFRLLNSATKIFLGVLAAAVWLSALVPFR